MRIKNVLIILIIIAVVVCGAIAAYTFMNSDVQYTDLKVSGSCILSVPESDDAVNSTDNYGIFFYSDREHNLNITSYNSEEDKSLSGAVQMASIRDNQLLGGKPITENGTTVYLNEKTGVYSIFIGNNETHDNILISCSDLDMLMHVVKTVKYSNGSPDDNNQTTGDEGSNNDNQQSSSSADSSSSNGCDHEIEGPDGVCIKCGKQLVAGDSYNGGQIYEELDPNSMQASGGDGYWSEWDE